MEISSYLIIDNSLKLYSANDYKDIKMTKDEELQDAYNKLDAAEMQITRLKWQTNFDYKVLQILIAAGFITQEKINEARDILDGLPESS